MRFKVLFADECAWRAFYIYADGKMFASLGIDPTISGGPQVFGTLAGRRFRFKLPNIGWNDVVRSGYFWPVLRMYSIQQSVLHSIDGRNFDRNY